MKKVIFLHLFLLIRASLVFAATDMHVMDFTTGKQIDFTDNYKELKDSRYNFYSSISIRYPQFALPGNKAIEMKINKRIKEILVDEVHTEAFKVRIFSDLDNRFKVLYKTKVAQGDAYGEIYDNKWKINPVIHSINYNILSYSGNVITIAAQFLYKPQINGNRNEEEEISYDELYYFDISNGKEYRPADVFKRGSLPAISKMVSAKMKELSFENSWQIDNEQYEEGDESGAEARDKSIDKEKTIRAFSADKDGYAYFKSFSMAFAIPEYSPGTEYFGGNGMELRLLLDEIRPYINPEGPYAHLLTLKIPAQNKWHDMNKPQFYWEGFILRFSCANVFFTPVNNVNLFEGTIALHSPDKTVSLIRYYTLERNNKDTITKKKVSKTVTYNEKGLLTQVDFYDYSNVPSRQYLLAYNDKDNLISFIDTDIHKKTEKKILFTYDESQNLLSIISRDKDGKIITSSYAYYADSFMLVEEYFGYTNTAQSLIKRIDFDANIRPCVWYTAAENNLNKAFAHYDGQGNLLSSYNLKESPKDGFFRTYINNKLAAEENDKGRQLTMYSYDDKGNMMSINHYDGTLWQNGTQFQYNDHQLPVSMKKLVNNNYFDNSSINRWFAEYEYRK